MCLFPKTISIKLQSGHTTTLQVPCGKCIECLQLRTHDWEFRLRIEQLNSLASYFLTITYEDSFLPHNGVEVSDMQKFFKRLRKRNIKFKYYCIGEYGTINKRPHYHCIIFIKEKFIPLNEFHSLCISSWTKGFIKLSPLSRGRIHYCIAYLIGQKQIEGKNKQFTCMSKQPGIGADALNNKQFVLDLYKNNFQSVISNGRRIHCPRYFKKKLCNEEFTLADSIIIKCSQCLGHLQKIRKYAEEHGFSKTEIRSILCTPSTSRSNILSNSLYCNFIVWQYAVDSNKDFILKQRNKKLKND